MPFLFSPPSKAKLSEAVAIEKHHTELASSELERVKAEMRRMEDKLRNKDKELEASKEAIRFNNDVKVRVK